MSKLRIDLLLIKELPGILGKIQELSPKEKEEIAVLPRSFWQREILEGNVLFNSKRIKPGTKIEADQKDHLFFNWKKIKRNWYILFCPKPLPFPIHLDILQTTPEIIAVNKAAGMIVYTPFPINPKIERAVSLIDGVLSKHPELKDISKERPGIVHRLDKNTSGILLIARNTESTKYLKLQFKKNRVKKTYLALVKGKFPHAKFVLSGLIGKDPKNPMVQLIDNFNLSPLKRIDSQIEKELKDRYLSNVSSLHTSSINPKPSLTLGKMVTNGSWGEIVKETAGTKEGQIVKQWKEIFKDNNTLSLLKLFPVSGRTHQLRVQLAESEHSIIGDEVYGKSSPDSPCHCLHAFRLVWKNSNNKKCKLASSRIFLS